MRAQSGSRRRALLVSALLVVATLGCADVAGTDANGDEANGDEGADAVEEPAGPREPDVPPMHPEIDDWDATVVTFTTSDGPDAEVDVRVAASVEERARGLMRVEDVPDGAGMLFLFEEEAAGSFWMKDTLVPLDIAFLGPDGEVRAVLQMEPCPEGTACDVYSPGATYIAAVEVPLGWLEDAGVDTDSTATWPDPVPAG